jgi:HD superfamily phosphohydrolase YqeK
MKQEAIISAAVEFLTKQPFDAGHDLEHHQTVRTLAIDIENHIEEEVNKEALGIAAMWHDVVTESDINPNTVDRNQIKLTTSDYLEKLLHENGYESEFIETVILAVKYHSYEDEPRNIEGKVLYDADKLSAVDLARWRKVVIAHNAGKLSDENFNRYITAGKQWLSEMTTKLHFEYSKQLFIKRMTEIANDEWAKQLALSMGVDLTEYLH